MEKKEKKPDYRIVGLQKMIREDVARDWKVPGMEGAGNGSNRQSFADTLFPGFQRAGRHVAHKVCQRFPPRRRPQDARRRRLFPLNQRNRSQSRPARRPPFRTFLQKELRPSPNRISPKTLRRNLRRSINWWGMDVFGGK